MLGFFGLRKAADAPGSEEPRAVLRKLRKEWTDLAWAGLGRPLPLGRVPPCVCLIVGSGWVQSRESRSGFIFVKFCSSVPVHCTTLHYSTPLHYTATPQHKNSLLHLITHSPVRPYACSLTPAITIFCPL